MSFSIPSFRRLCRRLHYWFGVAIAIPFLIVAITGCILTFSHELDPLLSPGFYRSSGPERNATAQQILETTQNLSPIPIVSLQLPSETAPVWIVSQGTGKGANMGIQQETFFDPQNGHVLGRRTTNDAPLRIIHRLHNAFLIADNGRQIVGILGLLLAGMIITGCIVWWPPAQGVKRSFLPQFGTGTRLILDIHMIAALWPFLIIVMIAITGITMEFPQSTRAILKQPSGSAMSHSMGHPSPLPAEAFPISADQALVIAAQASPGFQATSLNIASQDRPHWRVTLSPQHGILMSRHQITIDARSGEIMPESSKAEGLGAMYLGIQHALHGGSLFGLAGRLAVLISGLFQAALAITGLWVWARRQRFINAATKVASTQNCTTEQTVENTL